MALDQWSPGTEHGTYAGYQMHQTKAIPACEDCRAARNRYMNEYRASHPEVLVKARYDRRARGRALSRLAREYPKRFAAILVEETRKMRLERKEDS